MSLIKKKGINSFLDILFIVSIVTMILLPRFFEEFALVFVVGCMLLNLRRKFIIVPYFLLEFLFLAYAFSQVLFGLTSDVNSSMTRCVLLLVTFLYEYSMFIYLSEKRDFNSIINIFCTTCLISLSLLNIIFFPSLLNTGRLTTTDTSLSLLGSIFGGHASTSLSMIASIALSLYWIFCYGKNKVKDYSMSALLITYLLIYGSRKNLIFIVIYFVVRLFQDRRKGILRSIKYLLITVISATIGFYILMNVSVLYELWGRRLESVIVYYTTGQITDASIQSRSYLIKIAKNYYFQRPLFGWGIDTFSSVLNPGSYYAHNNFWEILSTCGFMGFIFYYSRYLKLAVQLLNTKNDNSESKGIKKSLLVLFFIMLMLENWQVTYMYENIMIIQVIMLAFCRYSILNKKIVLGGDNI